MEWGNEATAFVAALDSFAVLHEQRAARLAGVEQRLRRHLGEDHPRVVSLRRASAAAAQLQLSVKSTVDRARSLPSVSRGHWVVFGKVLDPQGDPAPGVRVRVSDRERKFDSVLRETRTNERGDFTLVYERCDEILLQGQNPLLFLRVQDARGEELHTSQDGLQFELGTADYFEVTLRQQPPAGGPAPRARRRRSSPGEGIAE
jgi:hypothetical protein